MDTSFTIRIQRYSPEKRKIWFDEFQVPYSKKLTVLDALEYIKKGKDASITYRSSCRMAICGSCGMLVNDKPVLACSTYCYKQKQPITIKPLKNFPIIKDLVVDTDSALAKFREAMPYTDFVRKRTNLKEENIQSPADLRKIMQASQCIKCMLCYSVCPVFAANKDFIGPAATASAYKYQKDTRDILKNERMDSLISKDGVFKCSYVGECSKVCPEKVDPALLIQKMKISGLLHATKRIIKRKRK
jgi:fumarate reductase iron-sulfur subunit